MRHFIAPIAVAIMIVGLLACPPTAANTQIPKDQHMRGTITRVFAALPKPAKGFQLDKESGTEEFRRESGWPVDARAVRVYEGQSGGGDDAEPVTLEIRVYLNRERSLPDPLGSETGDPRAFTHDGGPGTRFALAGVQEGRVALPLSDTEAAAALTVVRLFVGGKSARPYLDRIARGETPGPAPWDGVQGAERAHVRTIVVEYYGPRNEVDRLLKATRMGPLRALLTHRP